MAKTIPGMDEFFKQRGFIRHQHNYKGKGYYFSVGGYDITRADAITIFKKHQEALAKEKEDLLFDLDEIDNKPWRVFRQLAVLVPECEDTYLRLAAFCEQGGMRDLDEFLKLPKDK